jgi:hypothetical protein
MGSVFTSWSDGRDFAAVYVWGLVQYPMPTAVFAGGLCFGSVIALEQWASKRWEVADEAIEDNTQDGEPAARAAP